MIKNIVDYYSLKTSNGSRKMKLRNGSDCLVSISLESDCFTSHDSQSVFVVYMLKPATFVDECELIEYGTLDIRTKLGMDPQRKNRFKLYGGTIDPTDMSKFSIAYELNGVKGVLLGEITKNKTITITKQ